MSISKSMTPEDIAKRIWDEYCQPGQSEPIQRVMAKHIEQACAEARIEGMKDARDEDWKQWLEDYRVKRSEDSTVKNALWKCGKEIGKRVADKGWMNILPAQFELAEKEAYEKGLSDEAINCHEHCKKAYEKGFAEARENAAQHAEVYRISPSEVTTENIVNLIAQSIRALRPKDGGKVPLPLEGNK